jgi:hypothetical protein
VCKAITKTKLNLRLQSISIALPRPLNISKPSEFPFNSFNKLHGGRKIATAHLKANQNEKHPIHPLAPAHIQSWLLIQPRIQDQRFWILCFAGQARTVAIYRNLYNVETRLYARNNRVCDRFTPLPKQLAIANNREVILF